MRSIDVAKALLEKAIHRGKGDNCYYMDFIKLHKLMYLGQCYHQYKWGMDLFEEDVILDGSGPYVDGMNLIPAKCGFDKIKEIKALEKDEFFFPLTLLRNETCDFILNWFGRYSTMELVKLTKNTEAYMNMLGCCNNVINKEAMKKVGEDLFSAMEKDKDSDIKVKVKFDQSLFN